MCFLPQMASAPALPNRHSREGARLHISHKDAGFCIRARLQPCRNNRKTNPASAAEVRPFLACASCLRGLQPPPCRTAIPGKEHGLTSPTKMPAFVSGHGFSRAVTGQKRIRLQPLREDFSRPCEHSHQRWRRQPPRRPHRSSRSEETVSAGFQPGECGSRYNQASAPAFRTRHFK